MSILRTDNSPFIRTGWKFHTVYTRRSSPQPSCFYSIRLRHWMAFYVLMCC